MKICKICGYENKDTSETCENCGAILLSGEEFEWVLLTRTSNQFEADIIKELLKENGVTPMIKRPGPGVVGSSPFANPLLGSAGQFDVFVMRCDLELARSILETGSFEEDKNGNVENDNEGY
jgi:hypothetical protein